MAVRINYQRNHLLMMAAVLALMLLTLYMALASPFSLLQLKQSETTEIKAVIVVARHGETTPSRESYFEALGEEPPEQWFELGGAGQLTGMGKERMFLLGKFLKMRYYERLLAGNPRKLLARSQNSDCALESAQVLLAGLNPPPRGSPWIWSQAGGAGSEGSSELAAAWQPKAVRSMQEGCDDLLDAHSRCLELDSLRAGWKNTTRYVQLLGEFRHDLQVLRQNTGLEFEDDLEMLAGIEGQLRARSAFEGAANMPAWYTSTLAERLAHIADATAGCRFQQAGSQRLFAGRLLDAMVKHVFARIRSDLTAGLSLLAQPGAGASSSGAGGGGDDDGDAVNADEESPAAQSLEGRVSGGANEAGAFNSTGPQRRRRHDEAAALASSARAKLLPPEEQLKLKLERRNEPNMFLYLTDQQHLTALLNALQVYTSQPHFGATLIVELHRDPVNQVHFLRLFWINSLSHNVLPEPVRVNPIACLDSVECSPQQFDRNLRHLMLDKQAWSSLCAATSAQIEPAQQQQVATTTTTTTTTSTTTASPRPTEGPRGEGPTERSDAASEGARTGSSIGETTTARQPDGLSDSIHSQKLDESLVVGPTTTTTPAAPPTSMPSTDTARSEESASSFQPPVANDDESQSPSTPTPTPTSPTTTVSNEQAATATTTAKPPSEHTDSAAATEAPAVTTIAASLLTTEVSGAPRDSTEATTTQANYEPSSPLQPEAQTQTQASKAQADLMTPDEGETVDSDNHLAHDQSFADAADA